MFCNHFVESNNMVNVLLTSAKRLIIFRIGIGIIFPDAFSFGSVSSAPFAKSYTLECVDSRAIHRINFILRKFIEEELATKIEVNDLIDTVEYDYPTFHLSMDCFWCTVKSGKLELLEHEAAKWLTVDQLDMVEWLPADVTLIDKIRMCL